MREYEMRVLDSVPEAKQIVAVMINGIISNAAHDVARAMYMIASGEKGVELLDRWRMKFMSHCDLGIQWDRMASGPTFFGIDEDGMPVFVRDGVWKPKQA